MNDYLQSIKAYLYDRAVSPLFGTFVASWVAWNYKFVLVLVADMDVQKKLEFISNVLYTGYLDRFLQGLIYPFVTSLLFIFIYPVMALPVYEYVRKQQKRLREIKQKIEDESTLTVEESRVIKRRMFDMERNFDKLLEERDGTIGQLKIEISKLEEKLSATTEPVAPWEKDDALSSEVADDQSGEVTQLIPNFVTPVAGVNELESSMYEVLQFIGDYDARGVYEERILEQFVARGLSRTRILYDLEELANRGMLTRYSANKNTLIYEITHSGRGALLKRA